MGSTTKNGNEIAWYVSIAASCIACSIAGSVLYFGFVDIQEGNEAWLHSEPDYMPKGNVAVRSMWGVIALLLCPVALLLLFCFVKYRLRFTALTIAKQWMLAIGAPLCLVIVLITFCAIGVAFPNPLIIPYPTKP